MKTVEIRNRGPSMSNRQYHACGCPSWWVRTGQGETARFLPIPKTRGDRNLECTVEVEDNTTQIYIGAGPNNKHGVRYTVVC